MVFSIYSNRDLGIADDINGVNDKQIIESVGGLIIEGVDGCSSRTGLRS